MSRVMTSLRKAISVITNNSLELSLRQSPERSNRNLVDHEHFGSGSSNFQSTWLSLEGGDNSSHDYVNPNLMEGNKQIASLDHHENFGKFSYAQTGNMLNFSGHSTLNKNTSYTRIHWTPEEDELLKALVRKHGEGKWAFLAKRFLTRSGKQLRARWKNHCRPYIKDEKWTEEEDLMLIRAHAQFGNQWAKIAQVLPGRTENGVKNHWNTNKRKNFAKSFIKNRHSKPIGALQQYIGSLLEDDIATTSTANEANPEMPSDSMGHLNQVNLHPFPNYYSTAGVNEAAQFNGFDISGSSALPELMPNPN